MTIYYFHAFYFIVCLLLYSFIESKGYRDKGRRLFSILLCLLMLSAYSLRSMSVGADTIHYVNLFYRIENWSWYSIIFSGASKIEPGILILFKALSYITNDYNVMLFVIGSLTILPLAFIVLERRIDPAVYWASFWGLGLYEIDFFILRQCLAGIICILGLKYLSEKRFLVFSFFVALAFCFHKSAVVWFVLPVIYYFYNYLKRYIWVFFLTPFPLYIIAKVYVYFLGGYLGYDIYEDSSHAMERSFGYGFVIQLAVACVGFLYYIIKKKLSEIEKIELICLLLCWNFHVISISSGIIQRISWYFLPVALMFVSRMFDKCNFSKIDRYCIRLILSGVLLLLFIIRTSMGSICPYLFFWES